MRYGETGVTLRRGVQAPHLANRRKGRGVVDELIEDSIANQVRQTTPCSEITCPWVFKGRRDELELIVSLAAA